MLLQKQNYSSQNPILIEAARRAIEKRKLRESTDPVLMARRAGLAPDPWQADVLSSEAREMILLCSRQTGKSTVSSVLAAHEAVYSPGSLILLTSPSLRQSQELFRKLRDVNAALESTLPQIAQESTLKLEYTNGSRIIALPGKEATIRGYCGVSLLIVDEASRVPDELYQAVRPMLAVSGGRMVLLSTPFGKRGFFHHEWTEGGDKWKRVKVTANECPRISPEWLADERKKIGEWWFQQEYMCEFVENIDSVFSYDDITNCLDNDIKPLFG